MKVCACMRPLSVKFMLASIAIVSLGFSSDSLLLDQMQPKEMDKSATPFRKNKDRIIVHSLKGIALCPYKTKVPESFLEETKMKGVDAYDLDLSKYEVGALHSCLSSFMGQELTPLQITEIKKKTVIFYRDIGRPVVLVNVPEQDITGGVLSLEVLESRADKITISGGKWFSKKSYDQAIRLKKGDTIRSNVLTQDIAWINRNPFRHADVVFSPSECEGRTDIEVLVKDQAPLRLFAGADNTGFSSTQYDRVFTGCNVGNVLGLGSLFSYQFSSSPDFRQFIGHSAHYTAFLPWRHIFIIYGGYASVHPHLPPDIVHESRGRSGQVSLRYEIPTAPGAGQLHTFRLGADFKRTDNNILLGGTTILQTSMNLFQFASGYGVTIDTPKHNMLFESEFFFSPGQLFPHMNETLYGDFRTHAQSLYAYGRFMVRHTWPIRSTSLVLKLQTQLAAASLPASETASLGGWDSVRGYHEREVQADNAGILSVEARFPKINIFNYALRDKKISDCLVPILFFDFGYGHSYYKDIDDGSANQKLGKLASFGPGVRYSIGQWLSFRFDLGLQLIKAPDRPSTGRRGHFSLTCSY